MTAATRKLLPVTLYDDNDNIIQNIGFSISGSPYQGFCRSFEGLNDYDYRQHEFEETLDAPLTLMQDVAYGGLLFSNPAAGNGDALIKSRKIITAYGPTRIEWTFSLSTGTLSPPDEIAVFQLAKFGSLGDSVILSVGGGSNNFMLWSHGDTPSESSIPFTISQNLTQVSILGLEISIDSITVYECVNGTRRNLATFYSTDGGSLFPNGGKWSVGCGISSSASSTEFDMTVYSFRVFHDYAPLPPLNRYMTRIGHSENFTLLATEYRSVAALRYKTGNQNRSAYIQSVSALMIEGASGAIGMLRIERNPTLGGAAVFSGDYGNRTVLNHTEAPHQGIASTGPIIKAKPCITGVPVEIVCDPPIQVYPDENETIHITYEALNQNQVVTIALNWLED